MSANQSPDIFITGGSGLLALNLAASIHERQEIFLALNDREINPPFNGERFRFLHDVELTINKFLEIMPKVVINAAGMTNVEECELNKARAFSSNVEVASNLARASLACGAKFVHISTDHIFRGNNSFVMENGIIEPVNYYARSKAIAEERILSIDPNALIIRTNFFGWGTSYRRSFSDYIIYSLRKNKKIKLFNDVFYTPILIEKLTEVLLSLIEIKASGVYNVVGNERLSKYNFGVKICYIFGLKKALLIPSSINDFPNLVKRPNDMSLSNFKLLKEVGFNMNEIEEQIVRLREQESLSIYKKIISL